MSDISSNEGEAIHQHDELEPAGVQQHFFLPQDFGLPSGMPPAAFEDHDDLRIRPRKGMQGQGQGMQQENEEHSSRGGAQSLATSSHEHLEGAAAESQQHLRHVHEVDNDNDSGDDDREEDDDEEEEDEEDEEEEYSSRQNRPCRHNKWTLAGDNGLLCIVCLKCWMLRHPHSNSCPDFESSGQCVFSVHCPYEHISFSIPKKKKKKHTTDAAYDGADSDMEQDEFFTRVAREVLMKCQPRTNPSHIELEVHRLHLRRLHLRNQLMALSGAQSSLGPPSAQRSVLGLPADFQPSPQIASVVSQPTRALSGGIALPPPSAVDSFVDPSLGVSIGRLSQPTQQKPIATQQRPPQYQSQQFGAQQTVVQLAALPAYKAPTQQLMPSPQQPLRTPPPSMNKGKLGGVALPGFHPTVGTPFVQQPSYPVKRKSQNQPPPPPPAGQPSVTIGMAYAEPQVTTPPWLQHYKGQQQQVQAQVQQQGQQQQQQPQVILMTQEQYQAWASGHATLS